MEAASIGVGPGRHIPDVLGLPAEHHGVPDLRRRVLRDVDAVTDADATPIHGDGSLTAVGADHSARFVKGTFANDGDFTVSVTRAATKVEASA